VGELSHLDDQGAARMVDVSAKPETERVATAGCRVVPAPETLELLASAGLPKGDALAVARVAGIMGAKRTPDLIPLCHPLPITGVDVETVVVDDGVAITVTVRTTGRTGVEMEALTGVSVAGLAVIDMVKAIDRAAELTEIRVLAKSGGRHGSWKRAVPSEGGATTSPELVEGPPPLEPPALRGRPPSEGGATTSPELVEGPPPLEPPAIRL